MSVDWRSLSAAAGLTVDGNAIDVFFQDQRKQRVYVDKPADGAIRIWSIVATRRALKSLNTPLLDAWRRNRLSELVGFTIDSHGRMIGESWIPMGISLSEWRFYVDNIARSSDRFEYLITGADEE